MRVVQIMGGARTTETAPQLSDGMERWGINNLATRRFSGKFEDWTRWFDLHHPEYILGKRPATYEWYKTLKKPIYFWTLDPLIPSSHKYPREDVQRFFGGERLFLSTLDWLIALAIYEGFQEIELFWFRMQTKDYEFQLPSAQYWIGQARGRGTKVVVHGESALNPNNKMYGFEAVTDLV